MSSALATLLSPAASVLAADGMPGTHASSSQGGGGGGGGSLNTINPLAGLRAELGGYISNLSAVNTQFNHRLHDRLGEPQYSDALRSEGASGSLWMRQLGGHEASSTAGGELKTQANHYVLQMGGDLAQWSSDGLDRWHLGPMWGVANESSNTCSQQTGYHSVGSVSGYSAGVYGTWYQYEVEAQRLYVDSWLLYNWFDNQVKGEGLGEEKYSAKGITTSLESGYTLKAGEFFGSQGTLNIWYLQPQAQAILMDVGVGSHREDNGTKVTTLGNDKLQTRLGVKTYLSSHHKMDDDNDHEFQPVVEINWIRNTKSYGVLMNGQNISRDGARNLGEIRTGVEGKLNNNLSMWGNIGVQIGNAGYSDVQGLLGVKYGF